MRLPPFYPADSKQRRLIERYLLSVSAYVICVGIAWIAHAGNMTRLGATTLAICTGAILVYLIVIYLIYRTGLNQRIEDSLLTRFQMLVAIGWITLFVGSTEELRGAMLMIYLFVAMFSLFTLTARQTAAIGAVTSAAYGLVILADWARGTTRPDLTAGLVEWAMLSVALAWLCAMTSYISAVRDKMRRTNNMLRAQSVELQRSNQQLTSALARLGQLVITDELTGLSNRRHFLTSVEQHIAAAGNERMVFGLCIIDIDHFKAINDRYGHQVGDHALRGAAQVMLQNTREYDLLARFGGEEFALVVTRGDEAITRRCAERLRRAVAEAELSELGAGMRLSVSIGATVFRSGDDLKSAIGRADAALYEAKRGGRNVVVMSGEELPAISKAVR